MRKRDAFNLKAREGVVLPDIDLLRDMGIASRDVPDFGTTDALGGGHNAISTDLLLGDFIGALSAKTSLGRAGITHLHGLVGDAAIPKATEDVEAEWISAEGGDATKTNPTLAQVSMTPHLLGAYTDITRKMLIQTSSWAERLIIQLLQEATARKVEAAVFNGSGYAFWQGALGGCFTPLGKRQPSPVGAEPAAPAFYNLAHAVPEGLQLPPVLTDTAWAFQCERKSYGEV